MADKKPQAEVLIADTGYDADWFQEELRQRKLVVSIPPKSNRKRHISFDQILDRKRHKIENRFGRLKDWRRIHTRYDRCAHAFTSASCIAAIFIFWI